MVMLNDETKDSNENDHGGDEQHPSQCNRHEDNDEESGHHSRTAGQGTNYDDNPEILFNKLLQAANKLWQQIKRVCLFVMDDLGGYQLLDRMAQWCFQHPQMAICVLAAGFVAFLPIFLFTTFALSTIFMTLTGFLVLEGTLLTILTMIMCGLLGALAVVLLFFILVGVATYFGVSQVYDMYGSTELQRTALRNFMQRDKRNSNENLSANTNQSTRNVVN